MGIFYTHVEQNYKGFGWLKTKSGRKQEIDIWIPKYKLAIEYDGEQHFKPMRYGTKVEMLNKLNRTKKLDKIKNNKISKHINDVIFFIRFNYKEDISEKSVLYKLKEQGVI